MLGILIATSILALLYYLYFDRKLIQSKSLQLEENEKFRHRLFAYISHEFKTPLTVIFGLTNRLKQNTEEIELVNDLEIIERHGTAMTNLVNQMIELNELEATNWKPDYVSTNLPEQLKLIIQQMQPLADNLGVRLELQINAETTDQRVDISKLRVIVNNLLSNAIKFSPKGDVVFLSLTADAKKWSITVKDNGPGIVEKEIGQIFELFYRGSQQHDKELPDSGIGLAYVKAVVKAMGGNLAIRNEKGAVFTVTFPTHHLPEIVPSAKNYPQTTDNKHLLTPTEITNDDRTLLLLVEDTPDVAKYIISCFPSENYKVIWARDGQEGKDKAIDLVPDIIVSDVRMPKMNGFELCESLKKHTATNHIPIVILTALADNNNKLQGLQAKADVYLSKPFQEQELVLIVTNLLYTRNQARVRYMNHLQAPADNITQTPTNTIQDKFIQEINNVLDSNYTDPYFGVAEMSTKLFLSRAQLHRKITAILGQVPSDLLRFYRLEKAAHLLKSKTDSVAQVASNCGFNDPSYFTKLFKEAYGIPPSTYRKQRG